MGTELNEKLRKRGCEILMMNFFFGENRGLLVVW